MSGYDRDYYLRPDAPEFWFGRRGLLRPDQLACVCYLYGIPFWGMESIPKRDPKRVLSIGAGEGHLEAWLEAQGVEVVGVETSADARSLYRGSTVIERAMPEHFRWADAVIFVESLEHIPQSEIGRLWVMHRRGTRWIVVNWPDYFPLEPDETGWDHVTRLDDALYEALSVDGDVRLRRGSHLVVDF